jgi:hypothetical protein
LYISYLNILCLHISYLHIPKLRSAWTACIPSGRYFIEQKGYQASQMFLSWISVGRLGWDELGWDEMSCRCGRDHRFDSHQLDWAFSYLLIFLFSPFPLPSYHICIFHICIFEYLHICIFASLNICIFAYLHISYFIFHIWIFHICMFQKCSAHE